MRMADIIIKQRDRQPLTAEEIDFLVQGYTDGTIPDYQMAAWAMAVVLNGMSDEETTRLTLATAASGEMLDLTGVVPLAVDKHSTGGVGDKTTLVVAPLVAACGLPVGKMSGRGLGFSGGTLDKVESIPGFRTGLTKEEFLQQLGSVGIVLASQSVDLAPFDGKLYALRDVTGTVESTPLIAASVMSKKIAAGAQAIVLDVKMGLGAFMPNLEKARELATLMVSIGELSGRQTVALISDMNQPLGNAVGNALEVREAIETLHGRGPADFQEHCLVVAAHMLRLGGKGETLEQTRALAEDALHSGKAWEKFRQMVAAQGGDVSFVDQPERLPTARLIETVTAPCDGFIRQIHAGHVGEAAVALGAGRAKKGDPIDLAVGFVFHRKVGDRVQAGEPLFTVHANQEKLLEEARAAVLATYEWSNKPVEPLPLFYDVITSSSKKAA